MYFKRETLPEESDIVLCTVTKVHYHSVFVSLNEYPGLKAMLHISEIAPGRIRNIGEYVKEGKVIVCKVLKVDEKKGHIDVSLRRVTESQRRTKQDILKQEQRVQKIVEFVAKSEKKDPAKILSTITAATEKTHEFVFQAFQEIANGTLPISSLKLDKKTQDSLYEVILQRITPPKIELHGKIKLECHEGNGVVVVKKLLQDCLEINPSLNITYLGAGVYNVFIETKEVEPAESAFKAIEDLLESQKSCIATFTRK